MRNPALFFELKNNQNSKDELFHVYVYNWLFGSDLVDRLLMIQSPFLESYLKRIIQNDSISIAAHDLLWRYYNTVSQFLSRLILMIVPGFTIWRLSSCIVAISRMRQIKVKTRG